MFFSSPAFIMDLLQFSSFPVLLTSFVFIFMVFTISKKSKRNDASAIPPPPGPWKLPLLGNVHQFICSLPHHRLRDLANKYGQLMHLQLGEVSNIVVSSAEVAKEVLKTHDITFSHRPYLFASQILTYNFTDIAYAPYGEYWRQMRKICTLELLSARRVQAMIPIRDQEVKEFVNSIYSKAGSKINLSEMLMSLTYEITSRTAFGGRTEDHEKYIPLLRKMVELGAGFSFVDLFPSVKLFHVMSGMRTKLERLHKKSDSILEKIIEEHRLKKAMIGSREDAANNDLLDVMLDLQENGNFGFQFTINNVKAVIQDIFLGGSETSSTAMEWAMSELLKNPKVMEKAQAEVRQVFGSKGYVDEVGLEELKFLKLVIKETLRLHPPLPLLIPRECGEKCNINGYEIPVKSRVVINAWAIGRDPNHWTEAERFYPERFLNSSIDYKGANFEYIPFGAGRRICPGMSFGIANVELPLANLLFYFDWKLPDNVKNEELDMTENFGAAVRRKRDLYIIPIPYHPKIVE
ncbi:cytochrome P450 71D9-like [Tripterygium wilfordii]|uniref:cytochrome P450 71D9-like n=1 Tax=Tripterygium wilfordii TaxID=458696 RepID=UPI0018F83262|nr:cytochrome P450 71D9-like [Tripterygium wilfordii]